MNKTITILISILLVFGSCREQTPETSLPFINLSELSYSDDEILLSDFAEDVSYFPLETNDSSLISEIHDAVIIDSAIVVFDYYLNTVQLFSLRGEFIKSLSDHKKVAPDSSHIHQVIYDSVSRQLLLYTNGLMIHQYSQNGEYIQSRKFSNVIPFYIYPVEKKFLLYFPYPRSLAFDNYSFAISNSALEITDRFAYRDVTWKPAENDMVFYPNYYYFYDTLCFWNRYCDTVFGFIENQIVPRFVIANSKLQTARQNYYQIKHGITDVGFMLYRIHETGKLMFLESVMNKSRCHLIFNKNNKTAINIKNPNSIAPYAIMDDIRGGYPFWPDRTTKDYMLMFISAEKLVKYLSWLKGENVNENVPDCRLMNVLSKITIQDNPVIIRIKLKK